MGAVDVDGGVGGEEVCGAFGESDECYAVEYGERAVGECGWPWCCEGCLDRFGVCDIRCDKVHVVVLDFRTRRRSEIENADRLGVFSSPEKVLHYPASDESWAYTSEWWDGRAAER